MADKALASRPGRGWGLAGGSSGALVAKIALLAIVAAIAVWLALPLLAAQLWIPLAAVIVAIVTLFLLGAHWALREISLETAVVRLPRWTVTTIWFLMACAIILTQGSSNAFIYFQF